MRPSTIAWWTIVLGAVAIGALALSGCAPQAAQAPVSSTPVASVTASAKAPAPLTSGPEFLLHMTPDKTCAVLSGTKLAPFDPAKPDDKPAFGQYIEQTQAVNGKVKEHHLAVYDGRQWWDLSGIQECGK